jgi:hypothetical protein
MPLIELKRDPSKADLAWFGLVMLAFIGLVGILLWWTRGNVAAARYIWGTGVLLSAVYYLLPRTRRPLFLAWMYAAYPIGWAVSHVLLATIYFGLITSMGIVMRRFGYDPMRRTFDSSATTYWIAREPTRDVTRYFRQY